MAGALRLITRGDFDGVVCAALLRERGMVDEVSFVHPKDMQDGKIPVDDRTVTANLPYVPGCHLAFDHHGSEAVRRGDDTPDNFINRPDAPSAARVIYDHFGGADAFPTIDPALMEAVDKADSAGFSEEEILSPTGWVLLNFVLDARTGLGRFRDFRVSNEELLMTMIDMVRKMSGDDILLERDVSERVRLYFEHEEYFKQQLLRVARQEGDVVVLDLREENPIFAGNRFTIYALYPEARVSVHCLRGLPGTTVFAVGKSIIDRTSPVNVGELCLKYGGGGHPGAGTCQVPNETADNVLVELVEALKAA